MNTLFGFSIDPTISVPLGAFMAIAAVVALLAWRNHLWPTMRSRTIPHLRAPSILIVSGWMLGAVIIATFLAGCGKGGH
jgi:hypothetical protein